MKLIVKLAKICSRGRKHLQVPISSKYSKLIACNQEEKHLSPAIV